jgi:hypothetical protein
MAFLGGLFLGTFLGISFMCLLFATDEDRGGK